MIDEHQEDEMKVVDRRKFDSEGKLKGDSSASGAPSEPGDEIVAEAPVPPAPEPASKPAADSTADSPAAPEPAAPEPAAPEPAAPEPAAPEHQPSSEARDGQETGHGPEVEPVTFASFLMSMTVNALMALGEVPNPMTGESVEPDLISARQLIDILGILKEKSEGNRTEEETALLEQNLYQLRVRFVERSEGG